MRHELRLGDFEPVRPQADQDGQQDVAPDVRVENRRLMREAKLRMAKLSANSKAGDEASLAAQVTRDPMQNQRSEDAVRQAILESDVKNRWPRPRVLALIVVITLAAVVPTVTMRLLIWMVVLLLLTAVLLGPERARDAVYAALHHLSRMWGREIGIMRRLLDRIAH
ncbi:hypothetical protein [uncultured Shimia sp.]|uniref:hypothetical protein n=1 Tax=uncultured Shimia sp. TaxID=573152 RepID=UPI00260C7F2B|nr:hypothetical protein [uncultured Shimia sp.]